MGINAEDFGEDFLWGVSSSAYQTEGAWLDSGKGLSIWDVFAAQPGKIFQNDNGKIACDFHHHYIQDIILMQYLNIQNFRFSISWSRIFPHGIGQINEKGISYYNELIDFCLECGIRPWITLYHWDLPQSLEARGGWTNRDIIFWFSEYVSLCAERFGDRVKDWIILNEPIVFTGAGYFLGSHAPGRKGLSNFLPALHHAVLCQAIGAKLVKSFDESFNVGTSFSCSQVDGIDNTKAAQDAAIRVDVLTNRLCVEPLLGMGYPFDDLKILYQLEKYIHDGDEKLMQFEMDFIGLQNYTREVVKSSPVTPYINARPVIASKRNVPHTAMDWEIYPAGIYSILKKFSAYPKVKKIIITENGAAFNDEVRDGQVHDPERISFLQDYLAQVLKAKEEGVPVAGYFVWSFTDNFEWAEGYSKRFGLVYIDFATQKRIIKSSGYWYKKFLEKRPVVIGGKTKLISLPR